jgi:hypothetical protein
MLMVMAFLYFQGGPDYIGLHVSGSPTQGGSDFLGKVVKAISQTSGSSRAPIFYDSNNTGYLCRPRLAHQYYILLVLSGTGGQCLAR